MPTVLNLTLILILSTYSRVHISSDSLFSKILKKPSILQKKMIPQMNGLLVFIEMKFFFFEKKFKMADSKSQIIFQLRQFSIFFHENFMDWSLG